MLHHCIVLLCNNYSGMPGTSFHCLPLKVVKAMVNKNSKGKHSYK